MRLLLVKFVTRAILLVADAFDFEAGKTLDLLEFREAMTALNGG